MKPVIKKPAASKPKAKLIPKSEDEDEENDQGEHPLSLPRFFFPKG
jgi:hypothetical protein